MIYPNPIPVPWPFGLATLVAGAIIGSIAAKMLADHTDDESETMDGLDIREKLFLLEAMREAEEITPEEYDRLRKDMLTAFAAA